MNLEGYHAVNHFNSNHFLFLDSLFKICHGYDEYKSIEFSVRLL